LQSSLLQATNIIILKPPESHYGQFQGVAEKKTPHFIMKVWVDADATPADIKKILYKAAQRWKIPVAFVANQWTTIPSSPYLSSVKVARGPDCADQKIIESAGDGDLVITADIPLAAAVVAKGCHAISPRGEVFTVDSVGSRLSMRNFLDDLRSSGVDTGGPPSFSSRDKKHFANQLDALLSRNIQGKQKCK
jgi:uncharacterized protein YaiI (UPF0178 family)